MQEVRFDRLSYGAAGPILQSVIGEKQMNRYTHRPLSSEELYAFEREARRLRARAIAEAFNNGAQAVRAFFARSASAARARTVRHA
jgi:hypothetical protein